MFGCLSFKKYISLAIFMLCIGFFFEKAMADPLNMNIDGQSLSMNVKSFKEMRFNNIIRQKYDFSCGSAALATVLKYSYNREDIDEKSVLTAMFEVGDQPKIKREGFSMLDMKNYLSSIGLESGGYKAPITKLQSVGIPAITIINNNGYMHFVVINGITDDVVLVSDPSWGNRAIPRSDFARMWNGVLFVILSDKQQAQKKFQRNYAWDTRKYNLVSKALNTGSLADFALHSMHSSNVIIY